MEILKLITEISGYIAFYFVMLVGVCLIPLGLPGQFLTALACLVFILIAGSSVLPWWAFGVILLMAILAEVLEAIAGTLGAGTAQGSIWSCFGALAGGLAGAIAGSMVLPIVGSVFGVLAGTFLGAYAIEYWRTKAVDGAGQVAKGALIGRILGSIIKIFLALAMMLVVTLCLLF